MRNRFKSVLMNPWTIAIGASLFPVLITVIIDWITAERLFSTLTTVFKAIFSAIVSFLNYKLKIWWILLGIIGIFIIIYLFTSHFSKKKMPPPDPDFIKYTRDTILEYSWKWKWQKDFYGKWAVEDLHPVCPKCETPLVSDDRVYRARYICLRCNYNTEQPLPNLDNIIMLINDNVRRKYFPND